MWHVCRRIDSSRLPSPLVRRACCQSVLCTGLVWEAGLCTSDPVIGVSAQQFVLIRRCSVPPCCCCVGCCVGCCRMVWPGCRATRRCPPTGRKRSLRTSSPSLRTSCSLWQSSCWSWGLTTCRVSSGQKRGGVLLLLLHHPHWGLMPGRHWCGGLAVVDMQWLTWSG